MFSPRSRASRGAFSLIELLVVISIIGIIAFMVIPAATTIIVGTDVTRASQVLTAQLGLARQTAVTKNHPVEVRFLRYADPEQPGEEVGKPETGQYRGIQLMEVFDNGNLAVVGKLERLPGAVIFDNKRLSSLLDTTQAAESGQRAAVEIDASTRKDSPPLPKTSSENATKYKYVAFRFLADGSTNLSMNGKWYVTLYAAVDAKKLNDSGEPNINYFTVQIDPANGSVRSFRPTAGAKDTGGTTGS